MTPERLGLALVFLAAALGTVVAWIDARTAKQKRRLDNLDLRMRHLEAWTRQREALEQLPGKSPADQAAEDLMTLARLAGQRPSP